MDGLRITVGGTPVFTKVKVIPNMKEEQVLTWMRGEFPELDGETEEMIFDYALLESGDEGSRALLCAIKKSIIEEMVRLFDEIGQKISCINVDICSQIKFIHNMTETEGRNFILIYADGQDISASLYINGVFRLFNRARTLAERMSEAMIDEVEQAVSRMTQFSYSEFRDEKIEFIYVLGLEDVYEASKAGTLPPIRGDVELRDLGTDAADMVKAEDIRFNVEDYMIAAGNLIRE